MKTLVRYFRRRGLRWAAWGVRMAGIAAGVIMFDTMLTISPNGWSVVAVIAVYGVHRISDVIEKSQPVNITLVRADNIDGKNATLHVTAPALDDAVCRIIKAKAGDA